MPRPVHGSLLPEMPYFGPLVRRQGDKKRASFSAKCAKPHSRHFAPIPAVGGRARRSARAVMGSRILHTADRGHPAPRPPGFPTVGPTITTASPARDDHQSAACPATCPLCGGRLEPRRDTLQCPQCRFTICDGCEGGAVER